VKYQFDINSIAAVYVSDWRGAQGEK